MRTVFDTRKTGPTVRAQLWEQIEATVVKTYGQIVCRPEIWRYVSEPDSDVPEGENRALTNQLLWMLYGLSIILGTDWWTELSTTPDRPTMGTARADQPHPHVTPPETFH
jgi:hypothetical protein